MTALFLESQTNTSFADDFFIIGGLIQLIVGFVQLLGGLLRTIYALVTRQPMSHLWMYWLMVAVYFLILYFITAYAGHFLLFWIVTAWGIAFYYWIVIVFNQSNRHSNESGN